MGPPTWGILSPCVSLVTLRVARAHLSGVHLTGYGDEVLSYSWLVGSSGGVLDLGM